MLAFYREANGDYMAVDRELRRIEDGRIIYEGRATAIEGLIGSVCTTGISQDFLTENCRRVARRNVPQEWLEAIGLD